MSLNADFFDIFVFFMFVDNVLSRMFAVPTVDQVIIGMFFPQMQRDFIEFDHSWGRAWRSLVVSKHLKHFVAVFFPTM